MALVHENRGVCGYDQVNANGLHEDRNRCRQPAAKDRPSPLVSRDYMKGLTMGAVMVDYPGPPPIYHLLN